MQNITKISLFLQNLPSSASCFQSSQIFSSVFSGLRFSCLCGPEGLLHAAAGFLAHLVVISDQLFASSPTAQSSCLIRPSLLAAPFLAYRFLLPFVSHYLKHLADSINPPAWKQEGKQWLPVCIVLFSLLCLGKKCVSFLVCV